MSRHARSARGRRRLIAAVLDRMQSRSVVREAEARPRPAPRAPRQPPQDPRLEQLAAEAQYHRNRFELHRARVISGSPQATTLGRLRQLEQSATAAEERLAHAQRTVERGPRS